MTSFLRRRFGVIAALILAASPVRAQTASAPSSTGAVLLLAGRDDAASLAQLKAALGGADATIRETAARVVATGSYPALTNDLFAALAREQDPPAAREILRAWLLQGGESALMLADEQARRLGVDGALVVAEWLARVKPQAFIERMPQLLAAVTTTGTRVALQRILEMAAAQHPDLTETFERAWQALEPDIEAASPADMQFSKWAPAAPVRAELVHPVVRSLMTDVLRVSGCSPKSDRVGLGGIVFSPDGRPARIELGTEGLPSACATALGAIIRTSLAERFEPVAVGELKYIVIPFTESFAKCTAIDDTAATAGPPPASSDIKPPRRKREVHPVYPAEAQRARIQGTVAIDANLTTAGCIAAGRVVQSVRGLDVASLWAIAQWEYEPARVNGKPVPVVVKVTIPFTLR